MLAGPPSNSLQPSPAPSPRRLEGRVYQLHIKPQTPGERGLPKATVPEVRLLHSGLEGDFNRYRHEEKHDDPIMAVLIVPRETLEQLGREGWPVRPGDLGENITSEGIAYDGFRIGSHFQIGEAEVEITKPCDPCHFLELLPYVGKDRGPEFIRTMLNRRGWYARVIREGPVRTGDRILSVI